MQNIIKTVLICLLAFSLNARAQQPDAIVYYTKGKAVKVVGNKEVTLKKGDALKATDKLIVPANSELVMICKSYSMIRLNGVGTKTMAAILKDCDKGKKNLTASYFRYVWDEFTHPHGAPEKAPEKNMKTAGAVSRGTLPAAFALRVDTINYIASGFTLNFKGDANLNLNVYDANRGGERLSSEVINTGSLNLDKVIGSGKEKRYYWQLSDAKGVGTPRYFLRLFDKSEYDNAIKAIIGQVVQTSPAETAYMTAYLLEQGFFIAEAKTYYEKAVSLDPENKLYQLSVKRY